MVDRPKKPSAIPVSPAYPPSANVDISPDNNKITATLPTGESVEILLFGATVISWKSSDGKGGMRENLWLSDAAMLDGTKPVRGGIPLVFPVFGKSDPSHPTGKLPQHGFARLSRWEYLGKSTSESSFSDPETCKLDFGLSSQNLPEELRKLWPNEFGLIYSVTLTKETLETTIVVRNEGTEPWEFQVLMHTYLRIDDISKTTVGGLASTSYIDKVAAKTTTSPSSPANLDIASETDRIYTTDNNLTVNADGKCRFGVERENLPDIVVWNPWEAKASGMADFKPSDGWKNMLCVEAGSVAGWTKLDGGEAWEGGVTVRSCL